MPRERIVAVALLTQTQVDQLGQAFIRIWPVDETPCFSGLLEAIDEADRAHWRLRDAQATPDSGEATQAFVPPPRQRS